MLPVFASALASIVVDTIKSFLPDTAADKLKAIELSIKQQALENDLLKGQLEINKEEATNSNLFVAGWRPAIGWICGLAFAWEYFFKPIFIFMLVASGHPVPVMPELGIGEMVPVLMGMLGLGGLRTVEKLKGRK